MWADTLTKWLSDPGLIVNSPSADFTEVDQLPSAHTSGKGKRNSR